MAYLPMPELPGTYTSKASENLMKQLLQRRIAESQNAYQQGQLGIAREKLPLEKELLSAKAKEAQAQALKNSIIGKYLQSYSGDTQNDSSLDQQNTNLPNIESNSFLTNGNGQKPSMVSNQPSDMNIDNTSPDDYINNVINSSQKQSKSISRKDIAKQALQSLGILKVTPEEQQKIDIGTNFAKNLQEVDKKTLEDWNKTISSNLELQTVLEHNQEILANPKVQEALSHPEYLGYNIAYLKRFNMKDKELSSLLNQLGVNSKSLYSSTLKDFKGAVREYEIDLLKKFLPDEEKDNIYGIIAKNNAMLAMRDLITKRTRMAMEIYQRGNGQIPLSQAREMADKFYKGPEVRKQIEDRFKNEEKKQKKSLYKYQAENAIAKGANAELVNKHLDQLIKDLE